MRTSSTYAARSSQVRSSRGSLSVSAAWVTDSTDESHQLLTHGLLASRRRPPDFALGGSMTLKVMLSAVLLASATVAAQTQNLGADLQRAKQREKATGDCKSELGEYTRIAEQGKKSNRAAAAE